MVSSIGEFTIIRPVGSGEINYDASLLVLSAVFANGDNKKSRGFLVAIFLGIMSSMSRTGLLTACAMIFLFSRLGLTIKLVMTFVTIFLVYLSATIRGLDASSLEAVDRYWMWSAAYEYIMERFSDIIAIIPPGRSVPIDVPESLKYLWDSQMDSNGVAAIYPYNLHAFWLRFFCGWGLLPFLAVLYFLLNLIVDDSKCKKAESRRYLLSVALMGSTMGLFYLSNVSIPYILAYIYIARTS
jgi:hypothetical protein